MKNGLMVKNDWQVYHCRVFVPVLSLCYFDTYLVKTRFYRNCTFIEINIIIKYYICFISLAFFHSSYVDGHPL